MITGVRGDGYRGDIALDDISVTAGSCTITPTKADFAAQLLTTTTSLPTTQFITAAPRMYNYTSFGHLL